MVMKLKTIKQEQYEEPERRTSRRLKGKQETDPTGSRLDAQVEVGFHQEGNRIQ